MKPSTAAKEIQDQLGWRFGASAEFPRAWAYFDVRPATTATGDDRKKTDLAYCKWDSTFEQYVYNKAFVAKVVAECSTEDDFESVIGWIPKDIPGDGTVTP